MDRQKFYYFAYGSNMDTACVKKWYKDKGNDPDDYNPVPLGPTRLEQYRLDFNYYSKGGWSAGAANIMESARDCVYGLLMQVNAAELDIIRVKEGVRGDAYEEIVVSVNRLDDDLPVDNVITYKVAADKEEKEFQPPTQDYMNILINAAKRYKFPTEYTAHLERIRTK